VSTLNMVLGFGGAGGRAGFPGTGLSTSGQRGGESRLFINNSQQARSTAIGGSGGLAGSNASGFGGNGGQGGAGAGQGGGGGGGGSSVNGTTGFGGRGGSSGIPFPAGQNGENGSATRGGNGGNGSGNTSNGGASTTLGSAGGGGGSPTGGQGGSTTNIEGQDGTRGGGGGGGAFSGDAATRGGHGGRGGPGYLILNLVLQQEAPSELAVNPTIGSPGLTTVLITGTGLDLTTSVFFGNEFAVSWIIDDEHLLAVVPAEASLGTNTITINSSGGSTNTLQFNVVEPDSTSPACARLGTTGAQFALFAGHLITNGGTSAYNGDVGVTPGTSLVGFQENPVLPPGTIHVNDSTAVAAQIDINAAYGDLIAQTPGEVITTDLGGLTLTPGVYAIHSNATLTGTLTLDFNGSSEEVFIFLVQSTNTVNLTIAEGSSIVVSEDGVTSSPGCNVFWAISGDLTIGSNTTLLGTFINQGIVDIDSFMVLNGRVLNPSSTSTITVRNSIVNMPQCVCS
jgi:hypothetical protein